MNERCENKMLRGADEKHAASTSHQYIVRVKDLGVARCDGSAEFDYLSLDSQASLGCGSMEVDAHVDCLGGVSYLGGHGEGPGSVN